MNIQDIRQAYEGFLVRFAQVCNQGDYWIRYDGFAPKLIKPAGSIEQCISVEGILYLKGWPYKVVTRQKKIDILVAGTEHFDVDGSASVYSNVHVNYVDVNQMGTATLLENIHYDFQAAPDAAHPWFHAQAANNDVGDATRRKAVGFEYAIQRQSKKGRYKNMRLPTAHMNLPSVLLCLCADHMKEQFFSELVGYVRSSEHRLPEAGCDCMRKALKNGRDFCKSVHWY